MSDVHDRGRHRLVRQLLGYRRYVELAKQCVNVDLDAHDSSVLATLVTVPELDGAFIELETVIADDDDLDAALDAAFDAVHQTLDDLGVGPSDHPSETDTGAVIAARGLMRERGCGDPVCWCQR